MTYGELCDGHLDRIPGARRNDLLDHYGQGRHWLGSRRTDCRYQGTCSTKTKIDSKLDLTIGQEIHATGWYYHWFLNYDLEMNELQYKKWTFCRFVTWGVFHGAGRKVTHNSYEPLVYEVQGRMPKVFSDVFKDLKGIMAKNTVCNKPALVTIRMLIYICTVQSYLMYLIMIEHPIWLFIYMSFVKSCETLRTIYETPNRIYMFL